MADELDQLLGAVENYWAILERRRWWLLTAALFTWAIVWGVSWTLPATYQSEALILLEQQNVPNQLVVPNVNASVQDRLQVLSQQILSRTRLQAIITRYHLYPNPHGLGVLLESGDPVDKMRRDIEIEMVPAPGHPNEFTAFKMRYTAKSPQLAQEINTELTAPFLEENVEAQQQLSEETTSFLENQLADARIKMEEQEARAAEFKTKHPGVSPSQLEMGVQQVVAGLQNQLQNSHQSLEVARQHKLYLESLIQQSQASPATAAAGAGTGSVVDTSAAMSRQLDKEIADLRLRLQDLQGQYTNDHPDVVALKEKIAKREQLKKLADEQSASSTAAHSASSVDSAATTEKSRSNSNAANAELQAQLKENQQEIQAYQKREAELESQVSSYLARLNTSPEAEQEFTAISRDYEDSKAIYNSLLQKQTQSQLATRLEQRQKGEQFRILDPPSLPQKHVSPNHFRFSIFGMIGGILFGIGIIAILELVDIRVRHEKELKSLVPVHLLVTIPRLTTKKEERRRAILHWLDLSAVMIVVALIVAGNCVAFFKR